MIDLPSDFQVKAPGNVDFALHSLGWKAFQELCSTILSEILGQTVERFFDSHDGGRDGAFCGVWITKKAEVFTGQFAVQCKFTSMRDKQIALADLSDEIQKAQRLAAKGLATTYILMTNCRLTGTTAEELRDAFLDVPGIKHFVVYGAEWIATQIRESSRLRMLVPRVYGLGDLSQILDERAYAQATEILVSMGEDLSKFVITDAHRNSAKALVEHGFVLLLGEPASGKSTIAAALAVSAIDRWNCRALKVRDADEFVRHSNPNEKQFFWIDDAFGATQLDSSLVAEWNRVLPHLNAAIRRGSRVVFTSRDYIFRSAIESLKASAFPLLGESQVIIRVEQLSKAEREQILYNHLKLGHQPASFRKQLKPHLELIAGLNEFKPEIARRLSDPLFTKNLTLTIDGLKDFVGHPLEHLTDVIRALDPANQSALALIFMHGGSLPSPLSLNDSEEHAIELIGATVAGVRKALTALNESLVLRIQEEKQYQWRFKHPTIRDAFATLIADDPEMLDIYLAGSPPERLLTEITCGDMKIEGVKVIVPQARYPVVAERLAPLYLGHYHVRWRFLLFLAYRCDCAFLEAFLQLKPDFVKGLRVMSQISAVSDVDLICRLHEYNLLPEQKRLEVITKFADLAFSTPDAGFLSPKCVRLFKEEELSGLMSRLRDELIDDLDATIDDWKSNFSYNDDEDPEGYFDPLVDTLRRYMDEFTDDESAVQSITAGMERITKLIDSLREDSPQRDDEDSYERDSPSVRSSDRSVFDDIDQ